MTTQQAKIQLPVKESLFRGARSAVDTKTVSVRRDGGNNDAGLLSGVALISVGEALGHAMWIDAETLNQVSEFAEQSPHGVKSRFTHPGLSSDGTGKMLGRIHDFRVDGDRVLGDLHFAKSAHSTPDGDLADYVMALADEDPAAAGLSIVFEHDQSAELSFMAENGAEIDADGWVTGFESPDPANVNNYPHVRLSKLRAADVVDEPAANPDGLFDRVSLPRELDGLLCYAAGLSDIKPTVTPFGADADRAAQFFTRWLSANELSIVPSGEVAMSTQPEQATPEAPTRDSFLSELKKYTDRFGAEAGTKFFEAGVDYTDALETFADEQVETIESLKTDRDAAIEKLSSLSLGEDEPVDATVTQDGKDKERFSLGSLMKPASN